MFNIMINEKIRNNFSLLENNHFLLNKDNL